MALLCCCFLSDEIRNCMYQTYNSLKSSEAPSRPQTHTYHHLSAHTSPLPGMSGMDLPWSYRTTFLEHLTVTVHRSHIIK